MSDFICVMGPDPQFEGSPLRQYIAANRVTRVCPVWGVPDGEDTFIYSLQNIEGAQIMGCRLHTVDGEVYMCHADELGKLGICLSHAPRIPIGFRSETGSPAR